MWLECPVKILRTVAPSSSVWRLVAIPVDVDEFLHLRGVESFQYARRDRRADNPVGAVRMKGEPHLRSSADTRRNLVAQCDRAHQFGSAIAACLRERDRRRHDLDAGMSFGEQVAFVEFEPGAGRSVEQRRVEQPGALARAYHPYVARRRASELGRDQCLHFRLLHAGGDHRDRIRDHPARAGARRFADGVQLRAGGELRKRGQILRCSSVGHLEPLT
jgi:hypothetical protein